MQSTTSPAVLKRSITHAAVDVDFAAGGADVIAASAGAPDVVGIRIAAAWCVAAGR